MDRGEDVSDHEREHEGAFCVVQEVFVLEQVGGGGGGGALGGLQERGGELAGEVFGYEPGFGEGEGVDFEDGGFA